MASKRQKESGAEKRKINKLRDDGRASLSGNPCLIIVKYGKCADNLTNVFCPEQNMKEFCSGHRHGEQRLWERLLMSYKMRTIGTV